MTPTASIDPIAATAALNALLIAISDLLEAAADGCSSADVLDRLPEVLDLCREVTVLGAAIDVLRRRSTT